MAAVVGAVAGGLLVRSRAGAVPWDAVGLTAVAVAVVLMSPRGQLELGGSVSLGSSTRRSPCSHWPSPRP